MGLGSALLEFLFPAKCAFCGRVTELTENGVCPECMRDLPWAAPKDRKADFVRSVTAPLYYEGTVREALLRYKFHFTPVRGRVFGKLIGRETYEFAGETGVVFEALYSVKQHNGRPVEKEVASHREILDEFCKF